MIINNIHALDYDYLFHNKSDKIINILYNNIKEADKYVTNKQKSTCFNYNITKIDTKSQIPLPNIYDSHFFPNKIKKYIDEKSTYSLQFTCNIKNRFITVNFVLFEKITQELLFTLKQYIKLIYIWLHIVDSFSLKKCSNKLDVYIYLTSFKKELPNNQLLSIDSEHVNTAYTTGCQKETEIILYRKEEWFKVFIHETFHNFGLDFSNMSMHSVNKKLKTIFNVNVEFNLYESYCEFWGRTINTLMYSYQAIRPTNRSSTSVKTGTSRKMVATFITRFNTDMQKECKHSLVQALKILDFLDLKYNHIVEKKGENINICNYLYKENTSVFSYYIITSLLMNNYSQFMYWCSKNNNLLIQFKKTPGNIDSYMAFIDSCCKNTKIQKNITTIESFFTKDNYVLLRSLKMSINDIHNLLADVKRKIE